MTTTQAPHPGLSPDSGLAPEDSFATPVLQLRGVTKGFGRGDRRVEAVRGTDLTVHSGEVVALLGHNGAGKSVTLDLVLGLQSPDTGTVEVCGTPPRAAVRAGRVGAMLQSGALLTDLRVDETVRSIAALHGLGRARTEEVLERTGLIGLRRRKVGACSGGEQQRLRFALALLPSPDLVVLDEPTAGMDVTARQEFWQGVQTEAAEGRSIVFATHYLAEAEEYAPRTVLMAAGRVIADDSTQAVRSQVPGRVVRFRIPSRPDVTSRYPTSTSTSSQTGSSTTARPSASTTARPGASTTARPGASTTARPDAPTAADRLLSHLHPDPAVLTGHAIGPDRVELRVTDSDRFAHRALTEWGATDLEVVPLGLDEAFAELTRRAGSTSQDDGRTSQTTELTGMTHEEDPR